MAGSERRIEAIGAGGPGVSRGNRTMIASTQDAEQARIIAAVDETLVLDLAKRVIEIPSATGEEEGFARFLVGTMRESGFEAKLQEIYPGRCNAVGGPAAMPVQTGGPAAMPVQTGGPAMTPKP